MLSVSLSSTGPYTFRIDHAGISLVDAGNAELSFGHSAVREVRIDELNGGGGVMKLQVYQEEGVFEGDVTLDIVFYDDDQETAVKELFYRVFYDFVLHRDLQFSAIRVDVQKYFSNVFVHHLGNSF